MLRHIAGIIPVSGIKTEIKSPVNLALHPISLNYLAIERAVAECAYAGCDTIWVVCDDDEKPLIRHVLGDYVFDPVYVNRTRARFPQEHKRMIKIYYVPVGSRFRKRKSVWLSIMAGCLTSKKISAGMSRWLKPTKYYVSFPYGVYDPSVVQEHRPMIGSESNICLSFKGVSIKDNAFLGASFTPDVLQEITQKYAHDRYTEQPIVIFENINNFHKVEIKSYNNIVDWDSYIEALHIKLNKPDILPSAELNGIGVDECSNT